MKTTSPAKIELVAKLALIIEQRKVIEKAEKELKADVKAFMENNLTLEAGDFCVVISSRNRTDLDKSALSHDMGPAFVTKYSKRTTYDVMEIKDTKRANQETA